ncbi:MAG: Maf family protein [Xanthomonadales bacterium]|nr:Maf family protein [Xanthomonadales bacterium]
MSNESLSSRLILASSSKYRKMLLDRLGIPFECLAPGIDETPGESESPFDLVFRLADEKAKTVSNDHPDAIVIGSDQVAVFENRIIGKPGCHRVALEQLSSFSGKTVKFLTALTVRCLATDFTEQYVDTTRVCFRKIEAEEIERYLETEKPYDCAGAFKAESLGIALFEKISSDDPTALIGLPLIRTAAMLRKAGLQLP